MDGTAVLYVDNHVAPCWCQHLYETWCYAISVITSPYHLTSFTLQHLSKCNTQDPAPTIELLRGHSDLGSLIIYSRGPRWKIEERLNEDTHPSKGQLPSYATLKLRCTKLSPSPKPKTEAFLRVHLQIPYVGTEFEDPSTRTAQARTFKPAELYAYRALRPVVSNLI